MRRAALALVAALACAAPAVAQHRIPVEVLSVYDGDTMRVVASVWPGMTAESSVRVDGVDTPELRARCPEERDAALAARDAVRELVAGAAAVEITDPFHGRYAGRVVAGVLIDGEPLADMLIARGLGRPYDGGTRASWCE